MSDKNPSSKIPSEAVRSPHDRADDPLFVPHLEQLDITAENLSTGDVYSEVFESICGVTDDSQPVERYDGTLGVTTAFVAAHQAAACQVQWNSNLASIYTNPGNVSGTRWGSGTMISDDLFLTCGHLFDQTGNGWERPRQNGTTNIISPQEIARNMRLNFNFQVDPAGNLRAEQSFPILELIEYRLGGLDMAVCRIGGNPGATFGRTAVSATDATVPDMLCIIGHPLGLPKRIEAGPTTRIDGNLIRYGDIDTLGGNSGSGILRASDGRLVGIHTNGGCTAGSPGDGGTNFGQRIAAVIAASPTLQSLTTSVIKLKVADDTLVKASTDVRKFKIVDDQATLKFRDDSIKFKFSDDIIKFKIVDDQATLKFRDDIKSSNLDKNPLTDVFKSVGIDNPGRPGGFGRFGESNVGGSQPTRPFILINPHHSYAWGAENQQAQMLAEIEARLAQLEQAMATEEGNLAQFDAEYRRLLAEYEAAGGNVGNK